MTDERGALLVEVEVRRTKVRIPLDADLVREYLEADDGDDWIDRHLDYHPEVEAALTQNVTVKTVRYEGPESTDTLPPRVHPDQLTIV